MSYLLATVSVSAVERLSPSFMRVTLSSPELSDMGADGPFYDQRIKLLFPGPLGLPSLSEESWWAELTALPEAERGSVRTYTVRSFSDSSLVVDLVIHPGAHGPGSDWALSCAAGDRIMVLGPRAGTGERSGIEFVPGDATRLLLAGDETAVPAIASILSSLPADAVGAAFLEVPVGADVQSLVAPAGVEVAWLPREGAPLGKLLHEAVLAYVGAPPVVVEVSDIDVDPDLWETPTYSSSGESLAPVGHADRYAWIAGESKVVTALRRALVNEIGLDRSQVAFMGYWREGVAMRG